VRTAVFGWVELLARHGYEALAERCGWSADDLRTTMEPYWDEHDAVGIDADARSGRWFRLEEAPGRWTITQTLVDPEESGEWRMVATVDIEAALVDGAPTLRLERLDSPS
jgi:hypothetical protein